jgi:hypothetical protein
MLAGVLTKEKKMKNRLLVYVVLALALSGCTTLKWVPRFEERRTPQVTVSEGRIIVTPEILFYFPDERDVLIVWQLPKDSKYRFPTKDSIFKVNGIDIEGRMADRVSRGPAGANSVGLETQDDIVECAARNGGLEFTCRNKHTRSGVYKYTIRVVDPESKEKKPIERDPPLINM